MQLITKILLWSYVFTIACYSQAADPWRAGVRKFQLSDTTILNDSTTDVAVNDARKDFKDLFLAGAAKTDSYQVQLNPRAISFVQDYMEKHTRQLQEMKDWGRPYFDMMDKILSAHGLPGELKYLAVIESNLKSNALSWAGAVGPWQFMPATARTLGLKVGHYRDERTDYYKSTTAAAKYLSDLFSIYGDWLLVIAAYNGGAANVNHAIRRSGSHDFWNLQYFLPEESRNHVKKFIATHYIMEGNGGITTLTRDEAKDLVIQSQKPSLSDEEIWNSQTEAISGKYSAAIVSKSISMPIGEFGRYNPDFDKKIAVQGAYDLRLPASKMSAFNEKKLGILDECMRSLLAPLSGGIK